MALEAPKSLAQEVAEFQERQAAKARAESLAQILESSNIASADSDGSTDNSNAGDSASAQSTPTITFPSGKLSFEHGRPMFSFNASNFQNAPLQPIDLTPRIREAVLFFQSDKGGKYTKAQAVGIVSNLIAESGMHADIRGDGGLALGIMQWHPDRQARYAALFGKDMASDNSFEHQLEFVSWELKHTEQKADIEVRSQASAGGAAAAFCAYAERPANIYDQSYERAGTANELMQKESIVALKSGFTDTDIPARSDANIVVIGDSIAQGVQKTLDAPGDTLVGRSTTAVLAAVKATPDLHGKKVVLSTGLSNDTTGLANVEKQIRAAGKAGAEGIVVLGTADKGMNQDIAKTVDRLHKEGINVSFAGELTNLSPDGVHPSSYRETSTAALAKLKEFGIKETPKEAAVASAAAASTSNTKPTNSHAPSLMG